MEFDGEPLAEHAVALLSAARQLADSAADPSTATHLPAALTCVGEALDSLSLAFERAPHSLVPVGDRFEPISLRFERAAACWPEAYGCKAPSYERQTQLLCSLYEAGATLRVARRACTRAHELLVDMTAPRDRAAGDGALASNRSTAIR
jgi:hypothetical protein